MKAAPNGASQERSLAARFLLPVGKKSWVFDREIPVKKPSDAGVQALDSVLKMSIRAGGEKSSRLEKRLILTRGEAENG